MSLLSLFRILIALLLSTPAYAGGAEEALAFALRKRWPEALAASHTGGDAALSRLISWQAMLDPDSGATFQNITGFIREHPDWPAQARLKVRAELALRDTPAADDAVMAWFEANPPVTGVGKVKFAEALMRAGASPTEERVRFLLRDAWRNGDFGEEEEKRLLTEYGALMREQDHVARADRLLWDDKLKAAERMLPLLPAAEQAVAQARIALMENAKNAGALVAQVTKSAQAHPGLLFARLQWRAARNDDDGVREALLAAPVLVPYPEKWWKPREMAVRRAIDEKKYDLARRLLANHAQTEGQELADALWLSGWLHLEFLRKPHEALVFFDRMYREAKFPVSRARAAYWAGRAAERMEEKDAANAWYVAAAANTTTFYGQLAHARARGKAALTLPQEPSPRRVGGELAQAAKLALSARAYDTASTLIYHLIDNAKDDAEAAGAARIAAEAKSQVMAVRAAKRAMQRGVVLGIGYPRLKLPDGIAVEPALALAVARQESEFDPEARSRAGARGLMQLLPATAREVARKAAIGHSETRLTESGHNVRLGALYLGRLIESFDGSYVLAIAAYNAGPARVRGWLAEFGWPGNSPEEAVDWIEKIPFPETRNYVQRVLENLQVYRHLLGGKTSPSLKLEEDLARG